MNKIIIEGRLGKDAETRTVNGNTFLSMALAENQFVGKDKKTFWYDVIAFNFNEKLVQYYKKGSPLFITGQLTADVEVGKDNVARCRRRIVADAIDFVSTSKTENADEPKQQPQDASNKKTAPEPVVMSAASSVEDDDNSDLPF